MKRLIIISVLILFVGAFVGCGSSGSSSPVNPVSAPTIVSISPSSGGPGTEVSIQGRGFGTVQGNNSVSYSGATLTVTSWSENLVKVIISSTATSNGTFQIMVGSTVSNSSNIFTLSNPIISGINPQTGGPGTEVTLSGQFFGTSQGSSYVAFNGQTVSVKSWNNNQIVCVAPSSTQAGTLAVIVWIDGNRSSNTVNFTLSFPTISSITPVSDNVGATVTILGTGFGSSQAAVSGLVTIGGMSTTVVGWYDNQIQVKIPSLSAAGSYNVAITANGKQSTPSPLTVSAPLISSISPDPLVKNSPVTISGSFFGTSAAEGPGTIQIQNQDNTGFVFITPTYWSDSQIQFSCPIGGYLLPGTQDKNLTITVGGLTVNRTVTVD